MTILIVGCGDLGTEIGLRLVASGQDVLAWRRNSELLPHCFDRASVDLANELPTIPQSVTTVVITVAASSHTEEAYRLAHITGLTKVLDALERDHLVPEKVLLISSTTVYGNTTGHVDESTVAEPNSFSGRITLQAEENLHARYAGTATKSIVLRLSGIYGPGRTRLIDLVKNLGAVIPDSPRLTNRIHRDDAAAAAVHLLTIPSADPLYLGVDDHPVDLGKVLRFLARELNSDEPPTGPVPITRGGDKRCSNSLLKGTGFEFSYPSYIEGYRALLQGIGTRHP
ncbi:NAD(P)-dependent oxidoreductase [Arthrobacter psychrolactophilus]|uniref:NAD(P)-dependent oxidoreductase n=1 Tax=Arthrobacter psychrolactophilus TaxID=92442 RepID=A0A2V5IVK2_9MICC|nr:NAD-dependent epimerase/dehydratase family protein [Arthrobacter psychrolactophilus]PYI39442.1 NAD(P)-dependent oxidoreductase [Arthrobacter psychrolactophilus]